MASIPPKWDSKALRRVGPIPGMESKHGSHPGFIAPVAVGGDGKAMGFVAHALDEIQRL